MRRVIGFDCVGMRLFGTLDPAAGTTGLLIVSGGDEVRAGAHRGMALLAARLAAAGVPVFRFDRRGVGDSDGANGGYATSGPDIAAAAAAFRAAQPQVGRIAGFGNCDGATALALFGRDAGLAALILANPWLGDDPLPPPAAVRAHYARRLADPATWARLLRGGIDWRKLARGLTRAASPATERPLAAGFAAASATLPATIILAEGDRTAQHFAAARPDMAAIRVASSSHSFADADQALFAAILAALR